MTAPAPRTELQRLEEWESTLKRIALEMRACRYGLLADDVSAVITHVRLAGAPYRWNAKTDSLIERFQRRVAAKVRPERER